VFWEEERLREIPEEERSRAGLYGLLARLLAKPPEIVELERLTRFADGATPIGVALGKIGAVARRTRQDELEDEFSALFIGLTEGELRPYASYYLTGFLYEKPLAHLRGAMARLRVVRAEGACEPEDHIVSVCEIMHGLILGRFGEPATLNVQQEFFDAHVGSWAPRFFADLEAAASARLYRPVGTLGRTFMTIEREAFALSA
jgi:TorA maturation chaperone TorD